jgi:hypothetical protein
MKIMLETTQWEGPTGPNHIYIFEQFKGNERTAKAFAYVPFGTGPVQRFKKPMVLDLKGRTFRAVD